MRLLMTAGSVIAGVVVARWLGAEGLGTLAVINVTVATAVQLGAAGLPSASTYFISRDRRQLRSIASASLTTAFIFGSLLAAAVALLAWARPQLFSDIPLELISIAVVAIPFQLLTLIGLNIFLAVGDVERFNLWDLAIQAFIPINALLALVILKSGLRMLIVLNTAIQVIGGLVIVFLIWKLVSADLNSGSRNVKQLLASLLRYGLKFHVSILAGAIIFRADLLILNHYRGTTEAGVYSVASQVALLLMLLPGVIATLLFPRVTAKQDMDGSTTCLVARHTAAIMFVICVAAAAGSFLLPLLYGEAFAEAPLLLLILLPGVFVIGLESVLVQHLNAIGLPAAVPVFWLITLAVNVPIVVFLVQASGARGAAIASTLSYFLIFLLVTMLFARSTGKSFSDMFMIRSSELRSMLSMRRLTTREQAP